MRLLMINANYASPVVGGGQRSLAFLAEGLVRRGHEVRVLSSGPSELREDVDGVEHVRLRHHNLYWPFDRVARGPAARAAWHALDAYNPVAARAFGLEIDAYGPDLVHTNVMAGVSPAVWRSVSERGMPLVHTLRDYYVVCARSELYRDGRVCDGICRDCALFTAAARRISDRVDAVVGNSRAILDAHLQRGAFRATGIRRVILNGYRPERPPEPRQAVAGPLRLGYLGRLDAPKGIEWLLEAVARLPADRVTLDVAGSGDAGYQRDLEHRYASERIRFLGFTAPADLFARIDLLVVPSLWPEPLPRTVFEAYGHGLPVLGASRGGIPEAIDEGETGHVFDPADPDAFRHRVLGLANAPDVLRRLAEGAARKATAFDPERVVDEYLEVYGEALASRAGPSDASASDRP